MEPTIDEIITEPDNQLSPAIGMASKGSTINKKYTIQLFIIFLLWFCLFLGFNLIIDPYGVSPIQLKLHDININKPHRIDIDRMIKPYEVWRYQPKTIFIGTSRIHESINPTIFNETQYAPAYNAAIPASTLSQNFDNIEQFLKLAPSVKYIFAELFLYNFTGQPQHSSKKTWKQFITDYLALLFSPDTFLASIDTLIKNFKHGPLTAHIAKEGHWVPSSDFNPAATFSDSLYIQTVLSWNRAAKLKLQDSAFKSLDRVTALAHERGITLHLLITPNYPWDDYRLISLGYWPLVENWLRRLASYNNIVSYSQYNELLEEAPRATPKMQWWNDPTHFSLKMGKAMMSAFLGHPMPGTPPNFLRHLNKTTVNQLIAERRAGALHWAASHPDFVADFEEAKKFKDPIEGQLNLDAKLLVVDGIAHFINNYQGNGKGEASLVEDKGDSLFVSGWAVDEKNKRRVRQLIATVGNKVVSRGFVTVDRADIALIYGQLALRSGFAITIPIKDRHGSEAIRIFALMKDGHAAQLSSNIKKVESVENSMNLIESIKASK